MRECFASPTEGFSANGAYPPQEAGGRGHTDADAGRRLAAADLISQHVRVVRFEVSVATRLPAVDAATHARVGVLMADGRVRRLVTEGWWRYGGCSQVPPAAPP